VETAEQLQFLRSLSCDAVQGYFLYRPLREEEVADALKANRLAFATSAHAHASCGTFVRPQGSRA
jgi:predicted signal transduction protein with EAL and GGDEF domain